MAVVRRVEYFAQVLLADPLELIRLAALAATTWKFRFLKRCVGRGTVVGVGTRIVNAGNVSVGRDCLLQDYVYIRAGTKGRVTLGNGAKLNSFVRVFGHGGVTIGEDTQIGPGSLITTTDHDYRSTLEAAFKPVTIGRGCWLGANVTVLPGVTIGDFAVIGAGSVVNRDIPDTVVAVGVPARVLKEINS